jgi:branched-chain amino acid transport system substrate-binding protein
MKESKGRGRARAQLYDGFLARTLLTNAFEQALFNVGFARITLIYLSILKEYRGAKERMAVSKMALVAIVVVVVVVAGLATYFLTLPRAPGPGVTPAPSPGPSPGPAPTPAPQLRSVKIALLYDPTNPVLKGMGEAAKVAIEEINAGGGILGVKIDYKTWNTMKKVDVALAAYREAVVDWGAHYVILEGVSEEALALQEEGAKLYSQYPHILTYAGMASEYTLKVMSEYDKYKFAFRMFVADYDGNNFWPASILWDAKNVLGVKKIAILVEDVVGFRGCWEGFRAETKYGVVEQKPIREIAKELGLEVVYESKFPVGEKNFIPYLEAAYARGAEFILAYTSWYTDCVTFAKQWATSIARDIYLFLLGGANQWAIFWDLTGGAALGVVSPVYDIEYRPPISPYTQSFIKKMHERGLRVDASSFYYYSAIYHIKEAIEYVARQGKDPNNIDEVIKALETVPCSAHTSLPPERAFLGFTEKGRFHSYPAYPVFIYQFQGRDKIVLISSPSNPYLRQLLSEEFLKQYCHPELAKRPAELRAALRAS